MSVIVHWENSQHTAVMLRFRATWTWAEFELASARLEALVSSVSHRVDVLIDMAEAGEIPTDGLLRMGELYADALPNLGQYVFIGAPQGFEAVMGVADRYYGALGGRLDYHIA
jgi:hypothetical protein